MCTISGKLYKDQVSLAGLGPVTNSWLHIKTNFELRPVQAHWGVMGFTQGGKEDVFASLVAAGKSENVWAMCMYEGKKSNGTITIGGVDKRLANGTIPYVADVGFGFHSVLVNSINLGSSPSIAVGSAAILDTGTNVLLAPSKVMSALQSAMCSDVSLSHCKALWQNECVELTEAEIEAYPSLTMKLQGVDLEMSARDYLLLGSPLAEKGDQYCLGIRDGGSAGGSGFIIGDTTMRNYYLVFDLEGKKIGWGRVNKDNCGSI